MSIGHNLQKAFLTTCIILCELLDRIEFGMLYQHYFASSMLHNTIFIIFIVTERIGVSDYEFID